VWRGLRASMRARDPYGCYLAFGITCLFGLQTIVNMCVVLGLLPTKGLPLPFVSFGGTALVMSLFMAGVLVNISARAPEPSRMTLWQSLRTVRRKSKNRRNDAADVRVVVEVR
jgi:cell division protein FtsW